MNEQDQSKWVEMAVKLVLSLAALFPVYAILYMTFPASIIAFYLISAVIVGLSAEEQIFILKSALATIFFRQGAELFHIRKYKRRKESSS